MEYKFVLGTLAALFAIGSAYLYIRDIFRGNTKPHTYTWIIWSIVTAIGFLGQWYTGGGAGSWATGVTACYCFIILFLCFKYGTSDITKFDLLCLVLAITSIVPWLFSHNILWSVILATITDLLGFLPTIRKTWRAPRSESLGSLWFDVFKHGLSVASLQTYSLTTWLYPAAIIIAKMMQVVEISYLRFLRKEHKAAQV